ncbi:DUF4276 family protein [Nannocystaceae bacterium ST9]
MAVASMVSRSSFRFGVLCEDETDFLTLRELISRIALMYGAKPGEFGFGRRCGGGCGNLRRKAEIWANELVDEGCEGIIIVHDLDRNRVGNRLNDEVELRRRLERLAMPSTAASHICIPIEEIEAWFFSCALVMREISGKEGQSHPAPHNIERPKERLMTLSRGANKKPRFSTNDNPKYARILDLDACSRVCPSFRELRDFVRRYAGAGI